MSSRFLFAVFSAALVLSLPVCIAKGAESLGPQVRSRVDAERGRVWILTSRGVAVYDAAAHERLRRVLLPGWINAGEPYGCLPDLTLGPIGEAVIPSNVIPVLWRIDPITLAVTKHELRLDTDNDKDVGFTEVRYSPEQGEFIAVSGMHRTVWRIDRELRYSHKTAQQLPRAENCGAWGGWTHDSN